MTSFAGNLFTFVFLSLLIFSFRTVENGTHLLTSFVDRDPSLKSILSCLNLAGVGNTNHRSPRSLVESPFPISLRRRHRLFLHLTRVGTLDDDFFSGDDDDARSLSGRRFAILDQRIGAGSPGRGDVVLPLESVRN
ncbi:hypothetical protein ACFX2I_004024 [Malus domestica]|uniref:Uncharacterized protein n=1 Tax=Malus domestica TaxID=3750 RepID=A0A498IV70_MALDO|nr:hypothetical protein DVH24_028739 [Malus domestica]